jgi:hypothetical protein
VTPAAALVAAAIVGAPPSTSNSERDTARAVLAATAWLDGLAIDPALLRNKGLKGKKKLVEALDAYALLLQCSGARPSCAGLDPVRLKTRLAKLAAPTAVDRYHDLGTASEAVFKEDALSYLRAARVLERVGLLPPRYKAEIAAVRGRLDAHFSLRGPHQRRAYRLYLQQLGLSDEPVPPPALGPYLAKDPARFGLFEAYDLTHQLFVSYDFGERSKEAPPPFDAALRAELGRLLEALSVRFMAAREVDLVAELTSARTELGLPPLGGVRAFLLRAQNPNGSFGDLGPRTTGPGPTGELYDVAVLLHTTLVALDALIPLPADSETHPAE